MKTLRSNQGFTLIEVMIAIGILAIGVGAILVAENNSLDVTLRAKRMTTVAMLAKNSLIEAEREMEGKPFSEIKTESSGTYDAPYADYRWERKIKEITFPNMLDPTSGSGDPTAAAKDSGGVQVVDQGVEKVIKIATQYLSKSSREISITVLWTEKKESQKFSVSQYWVDLNHKFDMNEQPE
jgi:prepilin-type N-terminal cleavage/methylation domain-containing protein